MDKFLIALIAGLLGGAAGGYVTASLAPGDSVGNGSMAPGHGSAEVMEELGRLRAAVEAGGSRPMLAGSSPEAAAGGAVDIEALAEALKSRLDQPMREAVRESVQQAAGELPVSSMASIEEAARTPKKKVTLNELADELQLSGREMDELRQIRTDMENELIALLKTEDERAEDIRAELLEAKKDPMKQMTVGMKYIGRVFSKPEKLGAIMGLEGKYKGRVKETIGADKAKRLDEEFQVDDPESILTNEWRIGASAR